MSSVPQGLPRDFGGKGTISSALKIGFCVFCESLSRDILQHHQRQHKGNRHYSTYPSQIFGIPQYLAPVGVADLELGVCFYCKGIFYKHRVHNHRCAGDSEQFDPISIDEGSGIAYCLMCQCRCDDIMKHWKEEHYHNGCYETKEMLGLLTLLPKFTEISEIDVYLGLNNNTRCHQFAYRNRFTRASSGLISNNPSDSIYVQEHEADHVVVNLLNQILRQQAGPNSSSGLPILPQYAPTPFYGACDFAPFLGHQGLLQIAHDGLRRTHGRVLPLNAQQSFPRNQGTGFIQGVEGRIPASAPLEAPGLCCLVPYEQGFCVICEQSYLNASMHAECTAWHKDVEGKTNMCAITDFFGERICAPIGIDAQLELSKCEMCRGIFYKHRTLNHKCSHPDGLIDQGRGPHYCLMCQFHCDDVDQHWRHVHGMSLIYEKDTINEMLTLRPAILDGNPSRYLESNWGFCPVGCASCRVFAFKLRVRRDCAYF